MVEASLTDHLEHYLHNAGAAIPVIYLIWSDSLVRGDKIMPDNFHTLLLHDDILDPNKN